MEKFISNISEIKKIEVLDTSKYWLHTSLGKLLDLQMGNSAFVFGYSDKEIIKRITSNNVRFVRNGEGETSQEVKSVVDKLLSMSNMSALSWSVSGTDAVETALAISEHYWKITDQRKNKIVSLIPCYHGSSWLTRSLRGEVENNICRYVKAPSWVTQEEKVTSEDITLFQIKQHFETQEIGSIIIESIPWVLGVYPFSSTFWKRLKELCYEYNVLLILDDVAGCFGKLGKPFTHITLDIPADIIAVGKSISGGYSPIGAALINKRVFDQIGHIDWTHTYTFNPNTLGVSAIAAVLDKVENGVFDRTEIIQQRIGKLLTDLSIPYRNQGLCYDIIVETKTVYTKLKSVGFSFNAYNPSSVPIVAPLIADDEYFDFLKAGLSEVFNV